MSEVADVTLPAGYRVDCRSDGADIFHRGEVVIRTGESVAFPTGAGTTSRVGAAESAHMETQGILPRRSSGSRPAS